MIGKIKNQDGFTLLELMMVLAIIGIMSGIAIVYYGDTLKSSRDTAARSDANSLMTIISNNFIDREGVTYTATQTQGSHLAVGVQDDTGAARKPIFVLSPGVQISFEAGYDNMSYGAGSNTDSAISAFVYHPGGTLSTVAQLNCGTPTRTVQILIDETANVQELNFW